MTTFSQLLDEVVAELVCPDLRTNGSMTAYVNQTLREIHFRTAAMSAPMCFPDSLVEVRLTADSDSPFLWQIPKPQRFQKEGAAWSSSHGAYIQERQPRVNQTLTDEPNSGLFRYRSGGFIVFSGVPSGGEILFGYYEFPPVFLYKPVGGTRLITYNPETDVYGKVGGGTPTEVELEKETHWLLRRWGDTVKEGTRAKVHRRRNDGERAKMAYSSFESMRSILWASEGCD